MDKASSVLAALDAGKLPTQLQINALIDWTLHNILDAEGTLPGTLSEPGKIIAKGSSDVLHAYKQFGTNKNGDNLLQQAIWHLSQGEPARLDIDMPTEEATSDAHALRAALRTLIQVLWTNVAGESTFLLSDFASFARLAAADFAEAVEVQAARAKEGLREVEEEVQQGERDALGRKMEEEAEGEGDARVEFERTMDTVKGVGSKAIGAGQSVKASAEDTANRTSTRLQDAYLKICERAQNDKEYHNALSTLFDIASKWVNKTLDTAADVNQSTALDTFIDDPTEEKHVFQALHTVRALIERLAGEKSLDDLFAKIRLCAVDVRQDEDLKAWFNDFFGHVRQSLDDPGYEPREKHRELVARWKELLDADSDKGRKWKSDVDAFRAELRAFEQGVKKDADVQRVKRAHERFGKEVERGVGTGGQAGLQFAMDQASWFWQDMFNVYAQRILGVLKDIPIPRTEYVDPDVEFVLENLDISSLSLLPGHVYIRNITDVDISAPAGGTTTTAFGTLTHIRLQALQLSLKEVSFFYKDKTATIGPSDFTGLMAFTLPTQGVDIDLKIRLIPNTPAGLAERLRKGRFFELERVEVSVARDITLEVKESNHAVLASVFKPVIVLRFREALERTLEEQLRGLLGLLDGVGYDVGRRREVFGDTGLGSGAALVAAVWSEVGRLRRESGGEGLMEGWRVTGTGVVKDVGGEGEAKLAMGAEPQILSGDKRGPLGTNSQPLAERMPGVVEAGKSALGAGKGAYQSGKEGVKRVKTFKESVERKRREEDLKSGWESRAFDV
ncbi:hypothetical protein BV22DRAFT_1009273 [Leucogyrophana mollusca]|uniref:Uncharacterized protein n=1 Tax=Leucogyrophana mollusca TaxID=85980 RepID=A0ACB8BLK1_9AGAM|nr:hypothetical protein BV22DRAFT_1009273 [Leucogyrophana mollusca]